MAKIPYIKRVQETKRVYLPWETDPKSDRYIADENERTYFTHRKMNEREYQEFVNLTSTVKLGSKKKGKAEERAEMNMMLGTSRMFLLEKLSVGWNVEDDSGRIVEVTANNIKLLPPEVVKVWVDDIYDFNPILKTEEEEDADDKVLTEDGELLPKE